MERFVSNPIDQISEDIATALRTGALEGGRSITEDVAAMRLASDLLRAMFPDAPVPEKLDNFSVLVGACYALGKDKAKKEEAS